MKIIKILSFFIVLNSCEKDEKNFNSDEYFYGFLRSSNETKNPVLKINTRYDECGEWGGHNETITLFSKNDNLKLYAKYIETKVDCESLGKYGELTQNTVKNTTREISSPEEVAIKNYLKKLLDYKSQSFVTGNSGMSYSVINQDSTLTIYLYTNNSECKRAFKKLKSELKF